MNTETLARLRSYDVQIGTPERRIVYHVPAANPLKALSFILNILHQASHQPIIRSLVVRPHGDN